MFVGDLEFPNILPLIYFREKIPAGGGKFLGNHVKIMKKSWENPMSLSDQKYGFSSISEFERES